MNYSQSRLAEYASYHGSMQDMGDLDPGYLMMLYICDRFELNIEQRYWLAFLFSSTYCVPTVFYIYNRFPDFEMLSIDAMNSWWISEGRDCCIFQSDRAWVRSRNQFVDMVKSYQEWNGGLTQRQKFLSMRSSDEFRTYRRCYSEASKLYQMGRFSLFLYLESVAVVTGYPMKPDGIDLSQAESSRNGIAYAMGWDHLLTGKDTGRRSVSKKELVDLSKALNFIVSEIDRIRPGKRSDIWCVETSLCAYKKYKRGKRWLGYYIDRQGKEIEDIAKKVSDGVDWNVLWQYRQENYDKSQLKEFVAPNSDWLNWRL